MADLTSVYADRAAFGAVPATAPSSPLRLGALAAAAVGASRLALDASGNVTAGVLAPGDLPSVFTRRDVAETINESWTWAPGKTINFSAGSVAPPAATSRSVGTRVVLHPIPGGTEYAIGIDSSQLWHSVPTGGMHKWYTSNIERMTLDGNGALLVINGAGHLYLSAAGSGVGTVESASTLAIRSAAGGITFTTGEGSGLILPNANYTENLGAVNRKYLSLHCAALWAQTLIAADTMATIGGRVMIGPTTHLFKYNLLASDPISAPPDWYGMNVKHNQLSIGDWCFMEAAGKFEVFRIEGGPYPATDPTLGAYYGYFVTRNRTGSGLFDWYAGDALFNTGKIGNGFIDLYSQHGVNAASSDGPAIVGQLRYADTAVGWREHWAIGNLKGLYGNTTTKMGAAFGDRNAHHIQIDAVDGIVMRHYVGGGITSQWGLDGIVRLGYAPATQIILDPFTAIMSMQVGGVERISLRGDGTAHLSTGLVCGAFAGTTGIVRSNNATAFNVGMGFYFEAQQATGTAKALIGNSAGRRLQWDGASLRVVTDGLVLDEAGITVLQSDGTAAQPGRLIRFGTTGGFLYDSTAAPGKFYIVRETGNMLVQAGAGAIDVVSLYGTNRVSLTVHPNIGMVVDGTLAGLSFHPGQNEAFDLGTTAKKWFAVHSQFIHSTYGMYGGGNNFAYYLWVHANAAGKPISSTWSVPADRSRQQAIEPVDPIAALAIVRKVPISRFRSIADDLPAIGVIAQDAAALLPLSVKARAADGLLDFDAHELLMLNVAAVQALAARIDALDGRDTSR